MTIRKLINECEQHILYCDNCKYQDECERFKEEFGLNPSDFLDIEIDFINY